jgi:polyisoprenoid-binding protein YceI
LDTELGPSNATLTVHTGRAGMASKAGHDLVLVASRWSGSLTLDPDDPSQSRLVLNVDPTGLEVREGTGGVKPLSDADRAEIKGNLAKKVLRTDRHAEIGFVSTTIAPGPDGSYAVDGDLTLAGTTRPVRFQLDVEPGSPGTTLRASATIDQTDFGIKPYSALMGALKVADHVEIRAEARVP